MRKYPNITDIQKKAITDGAAKLSFRAEDMKEMIHPYSIPGYEYLSADFVGFMDRFRTVLPKKTPIVLEITGKSFNEEEKKMIDKAIWMHYGLYLSESSQNLKKTLIRMISYFLLMLLSSYLLFAVDQVSDEVILNYAYVLFWFFGYRLLIHLVLEFSPIYREYQWYRRLAALKLIFAQDAPQELDTEAVAKEISAYEHEADRLVTKQSFVEQVLMEETFVSLGCRVDDAKEVLFPAGVGDMEIVSSEMAEYLMSALPFIKQKPVTRLTIEGKGFTEEEKSRITKAIRNYLAFTISEQDEEKKINRGTSVLFGGCLLLSTLVLFLWGKQVNLAVHEFILISFWFFADYFLEFVLLSQIQIRKQKRALEKLANMEITFEKEDVN